MKIKGISYGWNSVRGEYCTDDAKRSLEALKNTNSEWIALTFSAWQDNHYSTQIYFDYKDTMTDYDIVCGINYAHSLGLKVCLKPVINIKSKVWRGFIYFPEDDAGDAYWKAWFETYKYFILHYANIAEMLGCEMFCIGCELVFTEFRTDDWMHIIQCVREVYHGPITYNANQYSINDE